MKTASIIKWIVVIFLAMVLVFAGAHLGLQIGEEFGAYIGIFLALLVTATILHHNNTYGDINLACTEARLASSLAERRAFFEKAYAISTTGLFIPAKIWIGSNPIKRCKDFKDELTTMLEEGKCS